MTREPLDIWLYGTQIAQVREDARGRFELTWTPDAEERWGRGARLLSAKLGIGSKPVAPLVRTYLDGLLPEGNARVNYALSAGVAPDDTYALIATYGRDTPGAAIFVPAGTGDPTRAGTYRALTRGQVAERLRRADEYQPATPNQVTESSTLPGMVPKITLHRDNGRWYACKDGAPSTWILKRAEPVGSAIADVVDTEVACLALAREVGLTSIAAEVVDFGDVRAIAVSRYDRELEHARIHQEDLAQAIGLNTQDPNRKFQWGSRMPSLRDAAEVLLLDGGNPDGLLRLVTFSLLVGNTDMHAKNISFLRYPDGSVALSPAYDISMHLHHLRDNRRAALDINGTYLMADLTVDDVLAEGEGWRIPRARVRRVVTDIVDETAEAFAGLDHSAHPGVPAAAWSVVEKRIGQAVSAVGARSTDSATSTASLPAGTGPTVAQRPRRRGPRQPG